MTKTAKASIDRRVVRTQKRLHEALLNLILKKGYEAITVEEICDAADISRSTFYTHYKSKDDLRRNHFARFRRQILEQHGGSAGEKRPFSAHFAFSLPMFQHAQEHLHHYKALVEVRGGGEALGTLRSVLCDLVRREITTAGAADSAAIRDLALEFVVGAYMSALTWWLNQGAKLPPEQMDAMFRRLAVDGVFAGLSTRRSTPKPGQD